MLEIADLLIDYNGIPALKGVSISVAKGAMVALIGPNGAGKSTLVNAVSGLVRVAGGSIRFYGQEITGRKGYDIARIGLVQVPEGRRVLGPMSVEENLWLGAHAAGSRGKAALDNIYALFPVLADRRKQQAGTLSGGQQQMLAIGRALMGQPRMLMLDEPSLGLAPQAAAQVFLALEKLHRSGLSILLIEQNARRALVATGFAYVLEGGVIVGHGPSAALAEDPAVISHYLGLERGTAPRNQQEAL